MTVEAKPIMSKKLWLLDVDGTIAERNDATILPGVKGWIATLDPAENLFAFVTNQGGVGLRYWMESGGFGEPEKYPTEEQVMSRLGDIRAALFGDRFVCEIFVCFRYLSQKGNWSPARLAKPLTVGDVAGVADCDHHPQDQLLAEDEDAYPPQWRKNRRKPDTGMLWDALDRFDGQYASFSDVAMIGNSDDDRKAARAVGITYYDADDFFAQTVTVTAYTDRPTSWLDPKARAGLDVPATNQRYEAMLLNEVNRWHRTKGVVRWLPGNGKEEFDCEPSELADFLRDSVRDKWINRSWLVYESAKAHIDALWAGRHLQQLVIVYSELVTVYGREAAKEIQPHLDQIQKEYREKYTFVLSAAPDQGE